MGIKAMLNEGIKAEQENFEKSSKDNVTAKENKDKAKKKDSSNKPKNESKKAVEKPAGKSGRPFNDEKGKPRLKARAVTLTDEEYEILQEAARLRRDTFSGYVRRAIMEYTEEEFPELFD